MTSRSRPLVLLALLLAACSTTAQRAEPQPPVEAPVDAADGVDPVDAEDLVHVKVLAFNDLHGNLKGPTGTVEVGGVRVEAGGLDHLAARIAQIRRLHRNTVVVAAGDLIGASPLTSSLFHDEPTIEGLNIAGLDVAGVGNHEFDEGFEELMRLQRGGCHPGDGCQDETPFDGAEFTYLGANVVDHTSREPVLPPYVVREFDGVKVGFIGLTLEGTAGIVDAAGVDTLEFLDEAETINAAAAELQAEGVEAIVVLLHEGGFPALSQDDPNGCGGMSGPIDEIAREVSPAVDLIVTGHTHQAYVCEMGEFLVTSAKSYGRVLTEIDLHVDRASGDVVGRKANNLVVDTSQPPHPELTALVTRYRALVAPFADKHVGIIESDLSRATDDSGESEVGRLIADAQLHATTGIVPAGADVAFMNPGGIRDDFRHDASGAEGDGVVTFAEAHRVQPFGNSLVTMTLSGAQILALLEAQFDNPEKLRILQPSKGFTYTWRASAPAGQKVDPASVRIRGEALVPEQDYRVTVNSYLANGGDGFTMLADGTERIGGPVDLDALVDYLTERSPVAAPTDDRITRIE